VQIDLPVTKPYVGKFAFAHKAGLHVDAVIKNPQSYQHIDPLLVGNTSAMVLSDQAGRHNLRAILNNLALTQEEIDHQSLKQLLTTIKEQEKTGYQFDLAAPSLELLIRRQLDLFQAHLQLTERDINLNYLAEGHTSLSAHLCLRVNHHGRQQDKIVINRQGLGSFADLGQEIINELHGYFRAIDDLQIKDYQVRMIHGNHNRGDQLRVVLGLAIKGKERFQILGFGNTFVTAAIHGLLEGIEYLLNRSNSQGL